MMKIHVKLRDESGAALIIENILILPVVFAVIIFVIYLGQMQYQKALIVSVAERSIIWIEQAESDYMFRNINALDLSNSASDTGITNVNVLNQEVNREPYRYVAGLFSGSTDYSDTEVYIKDYIESKEIFPMGDVFVEIEEDKNFNLYKKVVITIE